MEKIFKTGRRIKLGIWGLGRGQAFLDLARALNIDVVAGCDWNPELREDFHRHCPEALVTADETEFLACPGMDSVLVSTYFFSHAEHAVRCLEAGKNVMCEVTAFFTPAQGVRLTEAVEKSGKVFNLLENFPFTKENLYLKKLWSEGFFGEFMYGEFDYVDECRGLAYRYLNGEVVKPGSAVHAWRSWLDYQYYNTHSLGPAMQITGLRPVKISAFPSGPRLAGYPGGCQMNGASPSMIVMSNGGVVRNMMGAASGDSHARVLYGTRAKAEFPGYEIDTDRMHYLGLGSCRHSLTLRLGACGHSVVREVEPKWPAYGELADQAGHWGGDFWEIYYFAREVLTGEPAPWNINAACDVTLAGIMAVRSEAAGGVPQEIPDFRRPEIRERYRSDEGAQVPPFDPKRIFPAGGDQKLAEEFSPVMAKLFWTPDSGAPLVRRAFDGMRIYPDLSDDSSRIGVISDVRKLRNGLPQTAELFRRAKKIAEAFPGTPAADAVNSLLRDSDAARVMDAEACSAELGRWLLEYIPAGSCRDKI